MPRFVMLTTSLGPWEGIVKGKSQGNYVCCHVDGLNQTDQFKEDASLIYAMYWYITFIRLAFS